MTPTLESFAAQVRGILLQDNSAAGRRQVAGLLAEHLLDRSFVEGLFDDDTPERKVVHEDAQLGFCILVHRYTGAKAGPPHDHGPSWAIYGQADGQTIMSDWEPVVPGERPVKKLREYTLTPGTAHVYDEGAIHAPNRLGPTRLVRIEGTNLERVARATYQPVEA